MTDRSAPGSKTTPASVRTTTKTSPDALDVEQEITLRMRYGYALPDDVPLGSKAEGRPDVEAQLRAIELRAFQESGRYAELAAEAGVDLDDPEQVRQQAVKKKIIDRLTDPGSD